MTIEKITNLRYRPGLSGFSFKIAVNCFVSAMNKGISEVYEDEQGFTCHELNSFGSVEIFLVCRRYWGRRGPAIWHPPAPYFSCHATRKVGKRKAPLKRRGGSGRGTSPSDEERALHQSDLLPAPYARCGTRPRSANSIRQHRPPRTRHRPAEGPHPLGGGTGLLQGSRTPRP